MIVVYYKKSTTDSLSTFSVEMKEASNVYA